jgi:predicted nucleic acid-binding protein
MSGRVFLDTNIFVYSFHTEAPAMAKRASRLIREAVDTGKGIVSYHVVQEFFNVALRRFPQPMNVADAEQYLPPCSALYWQYTRRQLFTLKVYEQRKSTGCPGMTVLS